MRIIALLCFILFSTNNGHCDYPYFHFDESKVHLSKESFTRYVRPQIKNMVKEFYHLLKKGHPLHGDIILIRTKIAELSRDWQEWEMSCTNMKDECNEMLINFYKKARALDLILLNIQNSQLNFISDDNTNQFDNILYLMQKIDHLSNLNYEILHKLEELLITIEINYFYHSNVAVDFGPIYHKMLLNSEMILTSLLEKRFAVEFDTLWVNFMKQLESHIVQKQDSKYLLKNLGALNMSWNSFHMRIVKSNLSYPANKISIISIMHNRWNSVLKMIMASYKE